MKAFLDTSVLVATFYGDHKNHNKSIELFLRFERKDVCCGALSLAEVYSTLTGMPGKARAGGDDASLFLSNIREHLTIVMLNEKEYFEAVEASAACGAAAGGIYSPILGYCALKAKAESIYTWNLDDFKRIGPDIARRVRTP